jgi:hypothetical protein
MYKFRILAAVGAASALAAALALTLPAAASGASRNVAAGARPAGLPRLGTVQYIGSMRPDSSIHYRTALVQRRGVKAGTVDSTNWSGYAVTAKSGQKIGRVQTLFSVPSLNCANSTIGTGGAAVYSDWDGLDGFSNGTVEQTGIGAECTSATAPPTYFGFYEMFPNAAVTFGGISAGDAMVAVVQKVSTGWELVLQDRTTGASMTTVQACPTGSTCADANGEVITEAFNGSVAAGFPLANFGLDNQTDAVNTSASGKSGGFGSGSLWTGTAINMVNGPDLMASAGPLYGGEAFYDQWHASE